MYDYEAGITVLMLISIAIMWAVFITPDSMVMNCIGAVLIFTNVFGYTKLIRREIK